MLTRFKYRNIFWYMGKMTKLFWISIRCKQKKLAGRFSFWFSHSQGFFLCISFFWKLGIKWTEDKFFVILRCWLWYSNQHQSKELFLLLKQVAFVVSVLCCFFLSDFVRNLMLNSFIRHLSCRLTIIIWMLVSWKFNWIEFLVSFFCFFVVFFLSGVMFEA